MLSLELKDQLDSYLNFEITIEQLEDWLAVKTPSLIDDPDSDDAELTAAIELGLAEINADIRTEEEFRLLMKDELKKFFPDWVGEIYTSAISSNYTSEFNPADVDIKVSQPA